MAKHVSPYRTKDIPLYQCASMYLYLYI